MPRKTRPKLAVWKFASCDGCQLSLLDCEDELLTLAGELEISYFVEATRAVVKGPYDLSLVEGSIAAPHDLERIKHVRRISKFVMAIGACATAGGIQGLRNFADVKDYIPLVYARPQYIEALETSTPISAHIPVDFELQGCPINKRQLVEVVSALLQGRKPVVSPHSVCMECKMRGNICVQVAHGHPLPGAGDPRGLRRAVSHLPAGLLRLLRAQGDAQHRLPERLVQQPPGGARSRNCCVFSAPSTPAPRPFARRARPMTTRTIKVDYLARVEGEGAPAHQDQGRRWWPGCSSRSGSPPVFSRPFYGAAISPRPRTSPPASAASAPWPTR